MFKSSKRVLTAFILASCLQTPLALSVQAEEFFREAWDGDNDPSNIGINYVTNFYQLPTKAEVKSFPWTSSYFPNFLGGIAYRVQTQEKPFDYVTYNEQSVRQMTLEQISKLSPAEKYDIWKGDFSYPTVAAEFNKNDPSEESWNGLCHGWAPASINFSEPGSVTLMSKGGINVPFSSYDIKALLSYYQGEIAGNAAYFLGMRCEETLNGMDGFSAECNDVNAGAFHIVLTNEVGLRRQSFIFDRTRDVEVWNQPMVSYSVKILNDQWGSSNTSAYGTVREVEVETVAVYTDEIEDLKWNLLNERGLRLTKSVTYHYRLELDQKNRIIGGTWLDYERPDFLWRHERPIFSGYYGGIEKIYRAATPGAF